MPEPARPFARWAPPLALAAALVLAWEIGVRLSGVNPVTLPAPSRVLGALWDARSSATGHAAVTLLETLVGFGCSVAFAVATAVTLDRVAVIRRAVEPLLVVSQTIPVVAIAPLFVIWFGFGLLPKIVVVVLVTYFPITVALLDGFARVPSEATELLRSMGAGEWTTFRKLRWPAALPALFTGLKIAVVYAVIGAIFGEYVGAREGLGIWMQLSQNSFRTDLVFAAILLSAVIALALFALVKAIERLAVPWAANVRGRGPASVRPAEARPG